MAQLAVGSYGMDDEEEAPSPLAVDGTAASASLAVGGAPSIMSRLDQLQRQRAAAAARRRQFQQQQLQQATQRLQSQRAGPSQAEMLFAAANALVQPTSARGLAGVMQNILPVAQQFMSARRQAQQSRDDQMLTLQEKYGLTEMDAEQKGLDDEFANIGLAARLAPRQQRPRVFSVQQGGALFREGDNGEAVPMVLPNPGGFTTGSRAPAGSSLPVVRSEAELSRLRPGDYFLGPDGTMGQVPGGPTGGSQSGGFRSIPSGNPLDPNLGRY